MQKLPITINLKNGIKGNAKQIQRTGNIAIYKVSDTNYEVIYIRLQRAYEFKGTSYPSKEKYPSNEEWGTYAWTYNSIINAQKKFKSLVKEKD